MLAAAVADEAVVVEDSAEEVACVLSVLVPEDHSDLVAAGPRGHLGA